MKSNKKELNEVILTKIAVLLKTVEGIALQRNRNLDNINVLLNTSSVTENLYSKLEGYFVKISRQESTIATINFYLDQLNKQLSEK